MVSVVHKQKHTALDGLFRYAETLDFGEVHMRFDPDTGMRAIIAIHSLKRGPAIGGCRFVKYVSADAAFEDAIRLAYMMSYKAAVSQLNHGGAKAVVMRPAKLHDREAYFRSFARFVAELDGRYITAVDSGTTQADMDIVHRHTPYVTCHTQSGVPNDPSPMTVLGVLRGIEAAVHYQLKRADLQGVHVAIQGAGHVGYLLARELKARGASITMSDVNVSALDHAIATLGVTGVAPDAIYDVPADVFSPCALGAVLNLRTISRLRVSIVAGSANNQLAHHRYAALMQEKGILYAPDFVINAGGLIYVAAIYDHADVRQATTQVENIYYTLEDIFERAERDHLDTHAVAFQIAKERLA